MPKFGELMVLGSNANILQGSTLEVTRRERATEVDCGKGLFMDAQKHKKQLATCCIHM